MRNNQIVDYPSNKECHWDESSLSDEDLDILHIMGTDGLSLKYALEIEKHERFERLMSHLDHVIHHGVTY